MECCSCSKEIEFGRGIIVQGNIMVYTKDYPSSKPGLVGSLDYNEMLVDNTPEQIFCLPCFSRATVGTVVRTDNREKQFTPHIKHSHPRSLVDKREIIVNKDETYRKLG